MPLLDSLDPLAKKVGAVNTLLATGKKIVGYNTDIEGFKRNQELRDTGYVTYQQLGRIKNWFDNYSGDKTDKPFILNGADYMKKWVDTTIEDLRKGGDLRNDINNEVMPDELGVEELKSLGPIADMIRPSKEHSTFNQDIRIKEDVNRINNLMKKII